LTLQADREYTTRELPDDFVLQTDTPDPNYVQYQSECYKLTAQSQLSQNANFHAGILQILGGTLTMLFAVASIVTLLRTTVREISDEKQ